MYTRQNGQLLQSRNGGMTHGDLMVAPQQYKGVNTSGLNLSPSGFLYGTVAYNPNAQRQSLSAPQPQPQLQQPPQQPQPQPQPQQAYQAPTPAARPGGRAMDPITQMDLQQRPNYGVTAADIAGMPGVRGYGQGSGGYGMGTQVSISGGQMPQNPSMPNQTQMGSSSPATGWGGMQTSSFTGQPMQNPFAGFQMPQFQQSFGGYGQPMQQQMPSFQSMFGFPSSFQQPQQMQQQQPYGVSGQGFGMGGFGGFGGMGGFGGGGF